VFGLIIAKQIRSFCDKRSREPAMRNLVIVLLATGLLIPRSAAEVPSTPADVQQPNISGNATGAQLGLPFGQSFTVGSLTPMYGFALALVNTQNANSLTYSLWHTDPSGLAISGQPLATGALSAAQVQAFEPQGGPVVTPIWIYARFDQPYAQTPGERLAFTVQGANAMSFYFANGSTYSGGSLLGDSSKDLTFATIIPEPSATALFITGFSTIVIAAGKRRALKRPSLRR
jgi:hypothetical protein